MPREVNRRDHKAKWGQHFLVDDQIIDRILSYADIQPTETILEIGGGTGSLTRKLAQRCHKLSVIEADWRLAEQLRTIPGVDVLHGDALRVEFPPFDKTVSNLPYRISSEVTFKLLKYPFVCGVLMYQREFAERMVATPGTKNYSRLTVCLSYKSQVEVLERVASTAFIPRPRVDSAIVKLIPVKPRFDVLDEAFFHNFVRALFTQRRKRLKAALKIAARLLNVQAADQLIAKLPPRCLLRRPYELSPEEIATLSDDFFKLSQLQTRGAKRA
ncbi:MAG: 16S rRNA (adenine(1518)-N(6)/adenine(1519)-N(6))-dimethyltransferase RsmA [Halobacteriota archaeon]